MVPVSLIQVRGWRPGSGAEGSVSGLLIGCRPDLGTDLVCFGAPTPLLVLLSKGMKR